MRQIMILMGRIGIENFYGTLLPFKSGQLSEESYIQEVSSILEQYYLNCYKSESERDISDDWSNILKIEVIYSRGFTFMIKMDGLIRQATEDKSSLDHIALDLLEKRKSHQKTRQNEWIVWAAKLLGENL